MDKRPKCTVYPCKQDADILVGISYLCANHGVELEYINAHGEPLDHRVKCLHTDNTSQEIHDALTHLVYLHDETPAQLTAEDWDRARAALIKATEKKLGKT